MRLLEPLRRRDFALLFAGSTVSLTGDGIYTVALAFQVYALDNSPSALSLVLLCYSAALVVCALVAGVVVDRIDRRAVMIAADGVQLAAILAMGLVPRELLGRVSSLDWMLSFLLLPLSYALTGPLSEALGARELLGGAALAGAAAALALLALPGMRARPPYSASR